MSKFNSLFNSPAVNAHTGLPDNYVCRPLALSDYNRGFSHLLSLISATPVLEQSDFQKCWEEMCTTRMCYVVVIEECSTRTLVGAGTVVIMRKFTQRAKLCAHAEDIVVHPSHRQHGLESVIIDRLLRLCVNLDCCQVTLNCSEEHVQIYQRVGFVRKGAQMIRVFSL